VEAMLHYAFIVFLVGIVGGYIALWLLTSRLHHAFSTVWDELGRPRGYPFIGTPGENWSEAKANLRLMIFVCCRQYIELQDHRVAVYVWCVRICCALAAVSAVLSNFDSSPPTHFAF
jgi:hypothetical protein